MSLPTNPYEAPQQREAAQDGGSEPRSGRPCRVCGSLRTTPDSVLRPRPSVIFVILFGWLFLLVRGAFARRIETCRNCGAVSRHKSAGSWLALAVLILLLLLIWTAAVHEINLSE